MDYNHNEQESQGLFHFDQDTDCPDDRGEQ